MSGRNEGGKKGRKGGRPAGVIMHVNMANHTDKQAKMNDLKKKKTPKMNK